GDYGRLSFQQERIHVLSRLDPTGYNYHVVEVVRLSGPLDIDALAASIATIGERHEVLRSTFQERSGEPLQLVGTAVPRLERVDMRPCAKSKRAAAIERQARESLRQSFEVEKQPSLLEGVTELPLRADRPRPETRPARGARHPLKFSPALSRAIKSVSRDHRVTLFMTLLAACQCLLYRHTQHDDVAVGSVIASRNQIQIEPLLGMFANTIVLRTDLSGDPRFGELLRRVRAGARDA